jgi:signal recognition particle subunit SRP54
MFDNLTNKLDNIFKKLRSKGVLTEDNINESLREVRLALLEADVNFKVVKEFIDKVKVRAVGQEVMKSLTPGQMVIKVVHEELIELLSGGTNAPAPLNPKKEKLNIWMMVGLQGTGKTTAAAKIASLMKKQGFRPMLAAGDIYRPAAIQQLELLGRKIEVPVFSLGNKVSPVEICKKAKEAAEEKNCNLLILDTAGRLHIDEELMKELQDIKDTVSPSEILLVCDAMIGQDAVNVAKQFHESVGTTGLILSKLDGDARGGAILSIRSVTGQPIRFASVGEKIEDLELFMPERMASRILGMGDVIGLIEKVKDSISMEEAEAMKDKMQSQSFTFEDFRKQLRALKSMGPLDSILGMIPGVGKNLPKGAMEESDLQMRRFEAIINSMTMKERLEPDIINSSRKQRIARGSGTSVQEINQLIKQFDQLKKMMKMFQKQTQKKRFGRFFPAR